MTLCRKRIFFLFIVATMVFSSNGGERLYNGLVLPEVWPPRTITCASPLKLPLPYLQRENQPDVLPIDTGRQLFVDDFLIESTSGLERVFHYPRKYEGNPILKPETPWEVNTPGNAVALPKSGGIWWDPAKACFRLWYEAGWCREICYAESRDGIRWERPNLDVCPGTNRILPNQKVDSWSVWPEMNPPSPERRWNLFIQPGGESVPGVVYTSADGIHWKNRRETGLSGDRSSLFYNPFRRKWVWSLRSSWRKRSRSYVEHSDFLQGCLWHWPFSLRERSWEKVSGYRNTEDCVMWMAADGDDHQTSCDFVNKDASLYAFDAVGYESIMLGAFEVHWGPENDQCMKKGLPKITDIQFCYSRDGFHFDRPDRTAAIPSERWGEYGKKWDVGYVQSVANLCVIKGDELWFYYGAFGGNTWRLTQERKDIPNSDNGSLNGMYDNGAMGVAFLRRDGFAGLKARVGTVLTRPLLFSGRKLFGNFSAKQGSISVEVVDSQTGETLTALDRVTGDYTKFCLGDVSQFATKPVRLRFLLTYAELFSFWVSSDERGASRGYLAGGGPGYKHLIDN